MHACIDGCQLRDMLHRTICWLQVQRNWMYLENIFVGSEDIRKQLPQESLMFDGVNQVFMQSMAQLHAVGNVIQATNAPGVLTTFQVGCHIVP